MKKISSRLLSNILPKIVSVIAVVFILANSITASAVGVSSEKQEVVYSILDLDGSVDSIYVVNIFDGGQIIDYGNYSEVRNMTTSEEINQSGDEITINTSANKLYYQGTLKSKELPWNFQIKYTLDGKEISGKELAGKSGKLQIDMAVASNTKVNSVFLRTMLYRLGFCLIQSCVTI